MSDLHLGLAESKSIDVPKVLPAAPERLCLVCRKLKSRSLLLRLVIQKETKQIVSNSDGRKAGKGLYFCRSFECISQIEKNKKLKKQYLEKLNQHQCLDWMKSELESSNSP